MAEVAKIEPERSGSFTVHVFTNSEGSRPYKLYVPARMADPAPLLVMLHGCTQNPDDFAIGTRMNELAEGYGCVVVYPEQVQQANISLCWNWFMPANQRRDSGEAAIIADITRAVIRDYRIDERRVYVAGMSAGGAMAVVMVATYPELYSALGVHSGIAYRAAQNLFSALSTMSRGGEDYSIAPLAPVPVIVFHGDLDKKVHPRNGEQIIQQLLGPSKKAASRKKPVRVHRESKGRSYHRTIYRDKTGRAAAEEWLVHGTGHAWSGGNSQGSHTDSKGPEASREMLRFFLGSPVYSLNRSRLGLPIALVRRYLRRFKILPVAR